MVFYLLQVILVQVLDHQGTKAALGVPEVVLMEELMAMMMTC